MKRKFLLMLAMIFGLGAIAGSAIAQSQINVSGTVTEAETETTLPGVNIVVKGQTDRGTATNIDGEYSINVQSDAVLIFSYLGFIRQEISVNGRDTINVQMQSDVEALDELIVIGYGVQERSDNTGSVNVINSRDFNEGAITSPEELFQGRSAGVTVTSNSGAPGAGATIRIRGGSSLSASNNPLFVVDGLPLEESGISGMRNPLNSINPNDIESITILKDASATAIYGSRASNGVVLITTKRGQEGQPLQVNYTGRYAYQTNNDRLDVLGSSEFRTLVNERFSESVASRLGADATDWQDQIFRDVFTQDHNISVTNSYKNVPYRVSLGFSGNQGTIKTSYNDRLSGSIALNPSFFDGQLQTELNFRGSRVQNRFADGGAIGTAISFDPTQAVRLEGENEQFGGYFTWLDGDGNPIPIAPSNPLALIEQRRDESTVHRALGNIKLDYDLPFSEEITATINVGLDYSDVGTDVLGFLNSSGTVRVPEDAAFAWTGPGENNARGNLNDYTQRKENELLDFYLNYTKDLADFDSDLDLTLGYSWEHHEERGSNFSRSANTTTEMVENPETGQMEESEVPVSIFNETNFATEYYIVSFFGRANYSFKDKYLLTATLRNDGTSRFSPDNRWGLFPSFAFAWKLNEENFLQDTDWLSELKLRLGYGVTGQQRIGQGNYPYLPVYTSSETTAQYSFGNRFITTLRPEGYNVNLKWEETTTYNIGVDYSILNERFFGSIEAFYRETEDLLNVVPVPAGTNFTNRILSNVGNLEVQGLEFDITGRLISKENTFLQVSFNATYTQDEITKLTTVDDPAFVGVETGDIAGGTGNTIQAHSVGHPRSSFFVFEQVYNNKGLPIEGLYVDRNDDGVLDDSDKYRLESPNPDFTFGISSRFEHKSWDASFAARASVGNYVYNNVASNNAIFSQITNTTGFLTNPTSFIFNAPFQNAQYRSDHYLENASFIRLDNVSLGYTVENFLNIVSSLRISGTVQNVFKITEYSGQDPEVFGGIDNNLYPRPKTFLLGLNLNF